MFAAILPDDDSPMLARQISLPCAGGRLLTNMVNHLDAASGKMYNNHELMS